LYLSFSANAVPITRVMNTKTRTNIFFISKLLPFPYNNIFVGQ
jgi:hypothetical protein